MPSAKMRGTGREVSPGSFSAQDPKRPSKGNLFLLGRFGVLKEKGNALQTRSILAKGAGEVNSEK